MTKAELIDDLFKQTDEKLEYRHRLYVIQLQELICNHIKQYDDIDGLKKIAAYIAGRDDMYFVCNDLDDMRFEPREKVGEAWKSSKVNSTVRK